MVDFEKALQNALLKEFPNIKLSGVGITLLKLVLTQHDGFINDLFFVYIIYIYHVCNTLYVK